jgi:hypothetical protein
MTEIQNVAIGDTVRHQIVISPNPGADAGRGRLRAFPNSMLSVTARAGHFPMLEQPDEFNRVLRDFLDRYVASPGMADAREHSAGARV